MRKSISLLLIPAVLLVLASCSKSSKDSTNVSQAQVQVGASVSDTTSGGTLKGTMPASKTYNIKHDIIINAGDTLLIQKGVTLNMGLGVNFIVHGTLVFLGTKDAPITVTDPTKSKVAGASVGATDPAYKGGWGGIYCDTSCHLLVIKWTHIDFGGAALQTVPFNGPTVGNAFCMWFGCPTGYFVMEDSWLYGSSDDAVRFYGGKINVMRNTLEKFGGNGGDGFNSKSGTQGNMAYNFFIGGATNGTKSSNDGGVNPQNEITMYNNTYINCGFRNSGTFGARAGCAEVENNSRAYVYNNIMVDCLTGYRIAGGNDVTAKVYGADTGSHTDGPITQTKYGYNLMYASNVTIANQFVPTNVAQAVLTSPQSTDIPNMKSFLGANYTFGATYDGTSLVGQNDPKFVNYTLPNVNYLTTASIDAYNFHLSANSPAVGKGYTGFTPIASVPVDPNFGSSEITAPGADLGCFQTNGTGNQH
jgi:hypothetical protein